MKKMKKIKMIKADLLNGVILKSSYRAVLEVGLE